jgi:DNA polymerase-3 subunit gamma/tau
MSIPSSLTKLKEEVQKKPLAKEETPEQATQRLEEKSKAFTEEDFQGAWKKFAQSRKEMGKDSEFSILNQVPVLIETLIEINLTSSLQQDMFEKMKIDLMDYLRNTLSNFNIQIKTNLIEDTTVRKPYTQSDRYAYLASKNPILNKLREKLGLDPDF